MSVINLADRRNQKKEEVIQEYSPVERDYNFEETAEVNKRRKEKLARERNQANKSVLRSYRIKS